MLAQVFTPIARAAAPETIVSSTRYSVTIASPVDEAPVSIHCFTTCPPAADTIVASSAAEAARLAGALGCDHE